MFDRSNHRTLTKQLTWNEMESRNEEIEVTYIELDKYEKLVDGLYKKCEHWLEGKVHSRSIISMFNHVREKNYVISETSDKPDNFDFDNMPNDICKRSDVAWEKMFKLQFLFHAVVNATEKNPSNSPIIRAYHFGKYLHEDIFKIE